jgi:superfamily II DNA or RNA helicase
MDNLAELQLLTAYHKGRNDIAREFYLPCMARAISYDRAVGFFNSTIYILAWPSLKSFVERGGKMRIICSPVLSPEDIAALKEGREALIEGQNAARLRNEIQRMLGDPHLSKPTRVLATLVAMGVVEFRIAFMEQGHDARHHRLFHDKLGVFRDRHSNTIVFKGSMNETWAGLSLDGNLESVDVYASWEGHRDEIRVATETEYFETVWNGDFPSVSVRKLPDVALEELIKASDAKHWPELVDEICLEIDEAVALSAERRPGGRIPLPHQASALQEWLKRDRRGILEHATGSGKTFTALCAVRDALERGESALILVPSELLLNQWHAEVRETLQEVIPQILLCGAGNNRWRENGLLRAWTRQSGKPHVVIATMQTASGDDFLAAVTQGAHLFLVADEVHRLGSPEHQKLFTLDSGPRLGLSATPRRAGDPVGTKAIFDYFHGIVPPPFTLRDAVKAGTLTPYMYHVHTVPLTGNEQYTWNELTAKIKQLYARNRAAKEKDLSIERRIKQLLIERARIAKSAVGKIDLATRVLQEHYEPGQRWLVYCDTQAQLNAVLSRMRERGLNTTEYHTGMSGDRGQTLRHFEAAGGILVSIRCLDEGVDIPAVSHALILASSKNPREFIQRRGRVLRKAEGKALAFVHDAIVLPEQVEPDAPSIAILEGELARAIEFGKGAENPTSITDLQRIALRFGLDHEKLVEEGFEDDE